MAADTAPPLKPASNFLNAPPPGHEIGQVVSTSLVVLAIVLWDSGGV